ncbi:MAG TPA: septal ring lytic transglycosylase RlpA family protein [Candidatus Acidoferrales bacterium]|nr:septal ring lytic transglycosylase RlpA family protein [Candidatus Acidoferrales bacterium]
MPSPVASTPPPSQAKPAVLGMASWYGPGFEGRPTSSGKIYNQEELTAASTVFPLGSRVMVTNLKNGRSVEVTVTDHGPFKKGRKIDLSHKAARVIGMIGDGTAPVRIDLISKPDGSREVGTPPRYFVQLGSFSQRQNADRLRDSLAASFSDVHVDRLDAGKLSYYRVRMGAFATRAQAETRATDTAHLGLPIVIVSE